MKNSIVIIFSLIFLQLNIGLGLAQENNIQTKLWSSIGGTGNWNETTILLFSCSGNNDSDILKNESVRSLLWNRATGACRFEGLSKNNERLVYLFNFKSNKPLKLFISDDETNNITNEFHQDIIHQVKDDLGLLLLPTLADLKGVNFTDKVTKLVNNEKLISTQVESKTNFFNDQLLGNLLISEKTGEIKVFKNLTTGITYQVDQYKDTGSGLRLPTSFTASQNKKKSCTFATVSSFVQVEASKFTDL
ncbi:hypothetical protein LZQ00_15155 [Sphingobacterium sp. SRCM116780]|uniref:hypothetical protein n=1 Tax=Sphingobacterium sp. SRCM116780 TaxID=2907623 RepID=UPI001F48D99F|nr:hypothetical protein [Sphingobacterium sp. SRCM116780]UIR55594.1 hypothetical protein LZQ00_15155 [Sphingobacterium sp. SRCM116780]